MPVPPPPPPPAPPPPPPGGPPAPPPPAFSQGRSAAQNLKPEAGGRSALLSDIHKGARLRKVTEVKDRSAPVIDGAKKNAGTGNGRSAMAPPSGGLFAGGFPVLKPPGQRDAPGNKNAPQLPGVKANVQKQQDQPPSNARHDLPKPPPASAPATIAARPPPPRPTILGHSPPAPPPVPPSSNKPQLMLPTSQAPPHPSSPFKEKPAKTTTEFNAPPPLPPYTHDKSRTQRSNSHSFPPPPPPPPLHPPPAPPTGYTGRRSPSPSPPDIRDIPPPLPPARPLSSHMRIEEDYFPNPPDPSDLPPPPPPPFHQMTNSARRRLSEPLPPPPTFNADQNNAPARPPKGPPGRPSVPPAPGHGRPLKPAANSGGRHAPPPPPMRAPTTELSSKMQPNQLSASWKSSPQIYRPPSPEDFESKFPFHPVEDLPPPELFEPGERIYPSKCPSGPSVPPPQRPQVR
ncbi:WAS/WASL-interacting protein family member 3 [Lithobates pipiens]